MVKTVLYAEKLYPDEKIEREVYGDGVRVVWRNVDNLSLLDERDCADVDGLCILRHAVTAEHLAKFPKLACVVRMGVGYDKIDRKAAAARGVMVCNVRTTAPLRWPTTRWRWPCPCAAASRSTSRRSGGRSPRRGAT